MCDIRQQTNLKTKTVYKVVYKANGKYYAVFSGLRLEIGFVQKMLRFDSVIEDDNKDASILQSFNSFHKTSSTCYNPLMSGRTSGFSSLKAAEILARCCYPSIILKIQLGGSILKGTSANILRDPTFQRYITYAGTEVLSIKEIE